MAWLAALTFGLLSLGSAWFVYALTSNLEPMPEYPSYLVGGMRAIGTLIALSGTIFGLLFTGYGLYLYAIEHVFV